MYVNYTIITTVLKDSFIVAKLKRNAMTANCVIYIFANEPKHRKKILRLGISIEVFRTFGHLNYKVCLHYPGIISIRFDLSKQRPLYGQSGERASSAKF